MRKEIEKIKGVDYEFYYEDVLLNGVKYQLRYFTCPFCKYYQLDDEGNYLCYSCEDGDIPLPLPEGRTLDRINWAKLKPK